MNTIDPILTAKPHRKAQRFFFRVPNIIFELGLTPYDLALYCAIRRTTGEDGICFRSGATLARLCRMSTGQVSCCKKRLAAPFKELSGKPLIRVVERRSWHGGKPYHEIRVVDVWDDNDKHFSHFHASSTSANEVQTSEAEVAPSLAETKNNPKRKLSEEHVPSLSPASREIERSHADFSELWTFVRSIFGRTDSRTPTRAEKRQMLLLLPVAPKEYELVKWWMGLDDRRYDHKNGIGYYLRRRRQSVGALLNHWTDVVDTAWSFWKRRDEWEWK